MLIARVRLAQEASEGPFFDEARHLRKIVLPKVESLINAMRLI